MDGAALGALERKLCALDYEVPSEGLHPSAGPLLQQARAALRLGRAARRMLCVAVSAAAAKCACDGRR
jgi:hypothetical protein